MLLRIDRVAVPGDARVPVRVGPHPEAGAEGAAVAAEPRERERGRTPGRDPREDEDHDRRRGAREPGDGRRGRARVHLAGETSRLSGALRPHGRAQARPESLGPTAAAAGPDAAHRRDGACDGEGGIRTLDPDRPAWAKGWNATRGRCTRRSAHRIKSARWGRVRHGRVSHHRALSGRSRPGCSSALSFVRGECWASGSRESGKGGARARRNLPGSWRVGRGARFSGWCTGRCVGFWSWLCCGPVRRGKTSRDSVAPRPATGVGATGWRPRLRLATERC